MQVNNKKIVLVNKLTYIYNYVWLTFCFTESNTLYYLNKSIIFLYRSLKLSLKDIK